MLSVDTKHYFFLSYYQGSNGNAIGNGIPESRLMEVSKLQDYFIMPASLDHLSRMLPNIFLVGT